jgi:hypothetical protein
MTYHVCPEDPIPHSENRCVITIKFLVMKIMVDGAAPERNKVGGHERELISRVVLDGLTQPHNEPHPQFQ